jgi:hypothetical protein
MRKRRQIELFSISFLDLLSGALGAVIILFVAIPKEQNKNVSSDQKLNQAIEHGTLSLEQSTLHTRWLLTLLTGYPLVQR